jgi:hypothetical protein
MKPNAAISLSIEWKTHIMLPAMIGWEHETTMRYCAWLMASVSA